MKKLLSLYFLLAERLERFRSLIWLLSGIATICFVSAIFLTKGPDTIIYSLGSAIVLVWMISLDAVIRGFSKPMQRTDQDDKFFARIRIRASNVFRYFLVLFTSIVLITTVIFTFRAFGLLLSD
jgi:hypothetical protein